MLYNKKYNILQFQYKEIP